VVKLTAFLGTKLLGRFYRLTPARAAELARVLRAMYGEAVSVTVE
jgi:hypothetical protein